MGHFAMLFSFAPATAAKYGRPRSMPAGRHVHFVRLCGDGHLSASQRALSCSEAIRRISMRIRLEIIPISIQSQSVALRFVRRVPLRNKTHLTSTHFSSFFFSVPLLPPPMPFAIHFRGSSQVCWVSDARASARCSCNNHARASKRASARARTAEQHGQKCQLIFLFVPLRGSRLPSHSPVVFLSNHVNNKLTSIRDVWKPDGAILRICRSKYI